MNIDKLLWDIKKIEILSENFENKKILDFENNQKLFQQLKITNCMICYFRKLKKVNS